MSTKFPRHTDVLSEHNRAIKAARDKETHDFETKRTTQCPLVCDAIRKNLLVTMKTIKTGEKTYSEFSLNGDMHCPCDKMRGKLEKHGWKLEDNLKLEPERLCNSITVQVNVKGTIQIGRGWSWDNFRTCVLRDTTNDRNNDWDYD